MAKEHKDSTANLSAASEPNYAETYTVKDYLQWSFEGFFEIIKGKVFKMSPAPSSDHAKIDINLLRLFLPAFPKGKQACNVFTAPFDVYLVKEGDSLEKGATVVQPDVCVVCDASKIEKPGCIGAPDLVVEIISPSTARKDMYNKFNVYEEFGVKEYWIVFPGQNAINIFSLVGGKFELYKTFYEEEILQSPLFEQLRFKVAQVF